MVDIYYSLGALAIIYFLYRIITYDKSELFAIDFKKEKGFQLDEKSYKKLKSATNKIIIACAIVVWEIIGLWTIQWRLFLILIFVGFMPTVQANLNIDETKKTFLINAILRIIFIALIVVIHFF